MTEAYQEVGLESDSDEYQVESEEQTFHDIERPWNPDDIRVSTGSFSLRNMLDAIDEKSLDLAPDFQRLRVWKPVQKAQLIESILLQIPLPAFYFAEDKDGTLRVVDGVQRLSTIHEYCRGGKDGRGGFPLTGLEYVADVWGLRFKDLPAIWQRRIHNTQIIANVIAPTTPAPVMYDVFRRINTGGTPLNAQEIRHCMSRQRSREFLKRMSQLDVFMLATPGQLHNQRRMIDREVVLRFVAFWLLGPQKYEPPMDEFLWGVTERLDNPRQLPDEALEEIERSFITGLTRAHQVFRGHAFRKWPLHDERYKPFNRALFESWTVELARLSDTPSAAQAGLIASAAREAMTADADYISSITASTGDRVRVRKRFRVAREVLNESLMT